MINREKVQTERLPERAEWEAFYEKRFRHLVDLSDLHVPARPSYSCRAVIIVPGLTNQIVFDFCTKAFKIWCYIRGLNTATDIVERPQAPYVVWVRDTIEADPNMSNKSANEIAKKRINTLTFKERMVLELKYFDETGEHLDIENWTLCATSYGPDGDVLGTRWSGSEFHVRLAGGVYRSEPKLRARVAVS